MISKKLLFVLLLGLVVIGTIDATRRRHAAQNPVCANKEVCEDPKNKCRCFCARKGDFRERERGDAPMWRNHGVDGQPTCFCKEADAQLYFEQLGQEYIPEN